jgi:hypothetical protein
MLCRAYDRVENDYLPPIDEINSAMERALDDGEEIIAIACRNRSTAFTKRWSILFCTDKCVADVREGAEIYVYSPHEWTLLGKELRQKDAPLAGEFLEIESEYDDEQRFWRACERIFDC